VRAEWPLSVGSAVGVGAVSLAGGGGGCGGGGGVGGVGGKGVELRKRRGASMDSLRYQ